MQLQKDQQAISDAGIQVVAISYDSVEILQKFAEQKEVKFPLLSDSESTVIKAYGILNEGAGGRQSGIPHPCTFIVGKDGKVKAYLPGTVRDRHSTAALLEAAKKLTGN
ncbi:MAG: peroxiredoxin family protein [Pirellulales bacterium]|nr:peroxiredoxin family protein [Pirellulales bacterium]